MPAITGVHLHILTYTITLFNSVIKDHISHPSYTSFKLIYGTSVFIFYETSIIDYMWILESMTKSTSSFNTENILWSLIIIKSISTKL